MKRRARLIRWWQFLSMVVGVCVVLVGLTSVASADMVMKVLIVNPSDEVKEFKIHYPLPSEVKREHVLDADGLKVDYDSDANAYVLVGTVTLKPKESITKRVLLEDVWVIGAEQFTMYRKETRGILDKLDGTSYAEQGRLLGQAIERKISEIEESQEQSVLSPAQHIAHYRDNVKKFQMVEADLVSMRQLMVMSAIHPETSTTSAAIAAPTATKSGAVTPGRLSMFATWSMVFIILGLLGFVSLSFFLVWQRQLKVEIAKQAAQEHATTSPLTTNGHGNPTSSVVKPTTPSSPSRPVIHT